MFSWKRQRKEEEEAPQLAALPAAGVDAPPPSSSTIALAADEGMQPPTPAAAVSSSSNIELAARGAGAGAPAALPLERCSVRTKAAFFEALIHSNTTAHVVCSAEGGQPCSYLYTSGGEGGQGSSSSSSSDAAMRHADSSSDEAEDACVHLLLRVPRPRAAPSQGPPARSALHGSVADMEALIEQLQGALAAKEAERRAAVEAYQRRAGECDNLRRVVKELSESRSKAVSQRASLAERYAELQQEYHRMLRIADLSRAVSKENLATTSRTRSELRRVQTELHATKRDAHSLSEKHKKVRTENVLLKEKVTLLERLDFEEVQESECKRHFTRYRVTETY